MHVSSFALGQKIRKLREDKNISREQMADYLALSLRTYGKIESGERFPTVEEATKIAEKVEVAPEDLLYHQPITTFEHCHNNRFYNSGTIHCQSVEELQCYYERLLETERAHHTRMLEEKDAIIAAQRKALEALTPRSQH